MTGLFAQAVSLVTSAAAGGIAGYVVARWQMSKQTSLAELQREHDATMRALDEYLNWLVMLRYVVDPFDRRKLGQPKDSAVVGEEPRRYEEMLKTLLANEACGAELQERLADAVYDLPLDAESQKQFAATIDSLRDFWLSFRAAILPDKDGRIDTTQMFARILTRDALGCGELEAQEVNLGVRVISELRYHLLRQYKRETKGKKVLRRDAGALLSTGGYLVALCDGKLRYAGNPPFTSPEYLKAREKPLCEMRAENRTEAGTQRSVSG